MDKEIERLQKQKERLENTYKTGIISEEEYHKSLKSIDSKLRYSTKNLYLKPLIYFVIYHIDNDRTTMVVLKKICKEQIMVRFTNTIPSVLRDLH